MIESILANGPAFFNCFPKFSVSSFDPHAHEAISLGVQTQGFDMKPNSKKVGVIYRFYYQAMNSVVPDIAYSNQIKVVATLFMINRMEWNSIGLFGRWHLENSQPESSQENEEMDSIIENSDGSIYINFARNTRKRTPTIHYPSSIGSRKSESHIPSVVGFL